MNQQLDSTVYFVAAPGMDASGPFTLPQMIHLWRIGQIPADAQFYTEADAVWQPISTLKLDASDAEEMNARIWRVLTPERSIIGPFSSLELLAMLGDERISPLSKFWFPSLKYWIDSNLLQEVFDPNSEDYLASLRDMSQVTPPAIHQQETALGHEFTSICSGLGQIVGYIILIVIAIFALKSCN